MKRRAVCERKGEWIGLSGLILIVVALLSGCATSLPHEHAAFDSPSPTMLRAEASQHNASSVRRAKADHIKEHPRCAFCGIKGNIVNGNRNDVHHLVPISFRPDLGDVPDNLLTACRFCHFSYCHLSNWSRYNPYALHMSLEMRNIGEAWQERGLIEFQRRHLHE